MNQQQYVIIDLKNGNKCEGTLVTIDKINLKIILTDAKKQTLDQEGLLISEESFPNLEINKEDIKEVKLVQYEPKDANLNAIPENKIIPQSNINKPKTYDKDSSFFDNLIPMNNRDAKTETVRYNDKNCETFNISPEDNQQNSYNRRGNYRGSNRGGYRGNNNRGGYNNYRGNNRGGNNYQRGGYNQGNRGGSNYQRGGYNQGNRGGNGFGNRGGYRPNYNNYDNFDNINEYDNREGNSYNNRPNNQWNNKGGNGYNRPNNQFNNEGGNGYNNRPNNQFNNEGGNGYNNRPNNQFNNEGGNNWNNRNNYSNEETSIYSENLYKFRGGNDI
jgi:hypothetical protein